MQLEAGLGGTEGVLGGVVEVVVAETACVTGAIGSRGMGWKWRGSDESENFAGEWEKNDKRSEKGGGRRFKTY